MTAHSVSRTDDATVVPVSATGPIPSALAAMVSVASAVAVAALVAFYAAEISAPRPHVFGPISDIGTSWWDLLGAPLFWGLGLVLFPRSSVGRVISGLAAVTSIVGAAASTLLVVRVLPFGPSTTLSVVAVVVQAAWLYVVARHWSTAGDGRSRRLAVLGRAAALGQAVGVVLFAGSLVLGWGSPAQTVVMVSGIVPGFVGWASWPVWFALLSRELRRLP